MGSNYQFVAGACAIEITPLNYRNIYLAGFAPNRLATEVLDPLFVRVLYLSDGQTELAIAALDLIGLTYNTAIQIRQAVGTIDSENIFLCCTHSHSGPDTLGLWGPAVGEIPFSSGIDRNYMNRLKKLAVHAVRKAKKRAVPATIGFAENSARKDDLTWNVRQPGFMDHALTVMKVDRQDNGRTIATCVNYASHPESLWDMNNRISPDYPASIHRTLERALGGISIFVSGALGGMVTPGIDEDAQLAERESFYMSYGRKLAKIALDTAREIKAEKNPKIAVKTKNISMPMKNLRFLFAAGLGFFDRSMENQEVTTQVGQIRVGRANIATMPGELTPAVGLRIKSRIKGEPKFLFGLCNDEIGYVLEKSVFEDPLFEYESSMSLGAETADILADALHDISV